MARLNLILLLFLVKLTVSREIIDLTWDFSNETISWPDSQPFHYTKEVKSSERGYWYSANDFCMAEHGGTHFDAPFHFSQTGWTVDEIPPTRLIANGVFIEADGDLTKQDLVEFVANNGEFVENTVVLVKFNWARFWPNRQKYFGYAENSISNNKSMNFPGISADAAGFLANCGGRVVGVGVDTASLDPGNCAEFRAHRILANGSIYGLENVKITESVQLPVKGFTLVVSPLKLKGGSGSPVRIFAIIP